MGLALIGLGESRKEAPEEWVKWGLAWDRDALDFQRVFEMHSLTQLSEVYGDRFGEYWEQLADYNEVIMQSGFLDNSKPYPINRIINVIGDYFDCSAAYMIGLALYEDWPEIGLYGFDVGQEYEYQRPNLEYLIGFAKGRGVKVRLPSSTTLLTNSNPYGGRYGWRLRHTAN